MMWDADRGYFEVNLANDCGGIIPIVQSVAARATSLGMEGGKVREPLLECAMESVAEKFCSDE